MKYSLVVALAVCGASIAAPANAATLLYAAAFDKSPTGGSYLFPSNAGANATGPSIASTSASLGGASAQVKANATTGRMGVQTTGAQDHRAHGSALVADVLTFNIAGADAATQTGIGFTWLVHGSFVNATGGFGFATAELMVGNFAGASANLFSAQAGSFGFGNFRDGMWTAVDSDRYRFTGTYDVMGATAIIPVRAYLSAGVVGPITAAFGNTATISLSLPSNVTYTSQSGDFLTAAAAVPEPATWAMMILGFGLVGGAMRRRASTARTIVRFV